MPRNVGTAELCERIRVLCLDNHRLWREQRLRIAQRCAIAIGETEPMTSARTSRLRAVVVAAARPGRARG
jgi:hypothetical protein